MPDPATENEQHPEDPLRAYARAGQQGMWLVHTAGLVLALRLRQAPTKQQVANYIASVTQPVQGNRKAWTKMPWKDARKVVKKMARDLDRAMADLQREEEKDQKNPLKEPKDG